MTSNIQRTTWVKELRWWFSDEGIEMQYCLVAQDYQAQLFAKLIVFLGSGFTAIKIINDIEKELKNNDKS